MKTSFARVLHSFKANAAYQFKIGEKPLTKRSMLSALQVMLRNKYGLAKSWPDKTVLKKAITERFYELKKVAVGQKLTRENFLEYERYFAVHKTQELNLLFGKLQMSGTCFFRDAGQFEALEKYILPMIIRKKIEQKDKKINILSAPCSTGPEVYSLAILTLEVLKAVVGNRAADEWEVSILGVDASRQSIRQAKMGIYSPFHRIDPFNKRYIEWIGKYFCRKKAKGKELFLAGDEIKKMVAFQQCNFKEEDLLIEEEFDVVFCRYMLMYLNKETRKKTYKFLANKIDRQGYMLFSMNDACFRGEINNLFKGIKEKEFRGLYIYKKKELDKEKEEC